MAVNMYVGGLECLRVSPLLATLVPGGNVGIAHSWDSRNILVSSRLGRGVGLGGYDAVNKIGFVANISPGYISENAIDAVVERVDSMETGGYKRFRVFAFRSVESDLDAYELLSAAVERFKDSSLQFAAAQPITLPRSDSQLALRMLDGGVFDCGVARNLSSPEEYLVKIPR